MTAFLPSCLHRPVTRANPGKPPTDWPTVARLGALLLVATLAACGSGPQRGERGEHGQRGSGPDDDTPYDTHYANRRASPGPQTAAYLPAQHHVVRSSREQLTLAGQAVDLTLLWPSSNGRFPLIVFLPGLGDSVAADNAWWHRWATAGYGVAVLQASSDGPAVWSSPAAQAGDFRQVAVEQFAKTALQRRAALVPALLTTLRNRQQNNVDSNPGQEAAAHFDLQKIALAGFDLGAQTAQLLAGERYNGLPANTPDGLKCLLLLSPYADFSGPAFAQRYNAMQVPTLHVTSSRDVDDYQFVRSAALRQAPFMHQPAGDKYLLKLFAASHRVIGGLASQPNNTSGDDSKRRSNRGEGGEGRGPEGGAGGHGGHGGRGPQRGGAGAPDISSDGQPGDLSERPGNTGGADAFYRHHIDSISTAFLDAYLKDDPLAYDWLLHDARRRLGDAGDLELK